jgi:hypothetical protein
MVNGEQFCYRIPISWTVLQWDYFDPCDSDRYGKLPFSPGCRIKSAETLRME